MTHYPRVPDDGCPAESDSGLDRERHVPLGLDNPDDSRVMRCLSMCLIAVRHSHRSSLLGLGPPRAADLRLNEFAQRALKEFKVGIELAA